MIYLIAITNDTVYTLFDTVSESGFVMEKEELENLINNHGEIVRNVSVINGEIVTKPWSNPIPSVTVDTETYKVVPKEGTADYILVARKSNWNKVVNREAKISHMDNRKLKEAIKAKKIANCSYNEQTTKFHTEDAYEIVPDIEFEKDIKEKYRQFVAKSMLLGLDITFKYRIENREVKISSYTGTSREIVIPNFVTAIMPNAFSGKSITELKLGKGIKFIGVQAFAHNNIRSIEIPETVILIADAAFSDNNAIISKDSDIKHSNFKKLGQTILTDIGYSLDK